MNYFMNPQVRGYHGILKRTGWTAHAAGCRDGQDQMSARQVVAPRTRSITAKGEAGATSPRQATCWSGRSSTRSRS